MKSHLLTLCFAAFLLAVSGIIIAAPMTQPVRSLEIPGVPFGAVMTIDGVADEDCYSAEQSTTAFNIYGSTGADADFTATFRVCCSMERLYICWTILDDYACEIPYTTGPNPWTWDNVEVFLSLDTVGTTVEYDTNTIQLRFNRGILDSAQMPGRADQSEYAGNVYYENTANGWVLEVGIPWTAVLSEGQLPEDFEAYVSTVSGFDVSCADNDTDGPDARDCQTAWDDDDPAMPDQTEDLAWNNRTMFGVMTLNYHWAVSYGPPYSIFIPDSPRYIEQLVYPNPATDKFQLINCELLQNNILVYDISGTLVLEVKDVYREESIDISMLENGLYTVIINNRDISRFVKE